MVHSHWESNILSSIYVRQSTHALLDVTQPDAAVIRPPHAITNLVEINAAASTDNSHCSFATAALVHQQSVFLVSSWLKKRGLQAPPEAA